MSDSDNRRVKLLCNFGGEFARQLGRLSFVGGKTRLVLVDRSVNYEGLRSKMSQLGAYSPSGVEIKFQLPNETLDSRLVSVECDDDVVAMMSEFGSSQRIPVYIFDAGAADSVHRETGSEAVAQTITDCPNSIHGEDVIPVDPEDFVDVEDDLISIPRLQ